MSGATNAWPNDKIVYLEHGQGPYQEHSGGSIVVE